MTMVTPSPRVTLPPICGIVRIIFNRHDYQFGIFVLIIDWTFIGKTLGDEVCQAAGMLLHCRIFRK